MDDTNFKSCKEDPNQWIIPVTRSDGKLYWKFVLIYTDYILSIMEDTERFLHKELGARFTLKEK